MAVNTAYHAQPPVDLFGAIVEVKAAVRSVGTRCVVVVGKGGRRVGTRCVQQVTN